MISVATNGVTWTLSLCDLLMLIHWVKIISIRADLFTNQKLASKQISVATDYYLQNMEWLCKIVTLNKFGKWSCSMEYSASSHLLFKAFFRCIACHWTLSLANGIRSSFSHPIFLRPVWILSFHICLYLPNDLFLKIFWPIFILFLSGWNVLLSTHCIFVMCLGYCLKLFTLQCLYI